ncbi:MAG: DUF3782 domain-containing protein [Planctomycetes bacterium]|nr:DUF3782 domain-containing protein [Planctomycetota bacterium]
MKTQLLELIRSDADVRAEVERLLLNSAVMQEIRALREDMNRRFEEVDRRFEAIDRRFEAMIAELRSVKDSVSALGSRWGIQTETAVREFAQRYIASEFGVRAERWRHKDSELDIVIGNGKHHLIEITSWCDEKTVRRFVASIATYEQETGRKADRKIVVTAHATGPAWRLAQEEGIEVFSG